MQPIRLVQESDHLTAWLAFSGALIVALLAAVTAQARLRAQLYAEDKRHRDRLSFERGETDRRELRGILDALAAHMFGIREAPIEAITTARAYVDPANANRADREFLRERLERRLKRLDVESDGVADQTQRLRLRLGAEAQALIRAADLARLNAVGIGHHLSPWGQEPDVDDAAASREKVVEYTDRFFDDALALTIAQLHVEAVALEPRGPVQQFATRALLLVWRFVTSSLGLALAHRDQSL